MVAQLDGELLNEPETRLLKDLKMLLTSSDEPERRAIVSVPERVLTALQMGRFQVVSESSESYISRTWPL